MTGAVRTRWRQATGTMDFDVNICWPGTRGGTRADGRRENNLMDKGVPAACWRGAGGYFYKVRCVENSGGESCRRAVRRTVYVSFNYVFV